MSSAPVPVEVVGLTCRYDDVTAVDGVSFDVQHGELYALLGTNGAGKTTTLETLEGHRAPDGGTVRVLGGDPADRRRTRPRVGMMLQESGLAADLTVAESLDLVGRLSGRRDDVPPLLDRVGLADKANVRVVQLSGGERRRLDLAMAVYGSPPLLFLDEPTTALDPAARDRLWELVADLRREGTTVLLTTHYLEEAEQHADRIGVLHRGRLVREGSLAELVGTMPSVLEFEASAAPPRWPAHREGRRFSVGTRQPQADLLELLRWAEREQVELENLRCTPPSLAEIFRQVDGTSARDDLRPATAVAS
ncbi:ABC transporter ATP-binding protein [Cellulomonas sp. C5510]|uniref:ABC transporter ATP-binding protein n=1 Tax=Cellulomonas sp. C5510 TaxID=2871170 RepID=UPI001C957EE0|nr:ABC transporter ATP-binding protein [Cellulomonas sp. C5510]QZN84678.1 ABC transporter ATP-binding protein [Cellulomonas sp. C5510]